MTEADLDRRSLAMADLQATAERPAMAAIDRAMDRAREHAVRALTETLRATDPGRATIRKARSSPSYGAALADLDALLTKLCGPSTAATSGTLRDAREAAYRSSLAWWAGQIPEGKSVGPDPTPSAGRVAYARGLVLHGMDLRAEVGGRVKQAGTSLLAALERATAPGLSPPDAIDLIDGWDSGARAAIKLAVQVAIGDAIAALDGVASLDAIRPEFRPADEFGPPQE